LDSLQTLLNVLAVVNFFFLFVIVFYERKDPTSTWAWLLVTLIIPYVGFMFYLLLGLDGRKYKTFHEKAEADGETYAEYLRFLEAQAKGDDGAQWENDPGPASLSDMEYLNSVSGMGRLTANNAVTQFHEGNGKFARLLEDIRAAKSFIHMQYYIVRSDGIGREVMRALVEKAEQGVEVRFFMDGMGCFGVGKGFYGGLLEAGGKVAVFYPPRFIRINYRNHRKIAVIDGAVGYIGGLNIGDEYLGRSKRFGHWVDEHLRIEGAAVRELELRFIMDWNHSHSDKMHPNARYFPPIRRGYGDTAIQIVSSGPDTKWPAIQHSYLKMIARAKKSIFIQSPYFIPDDSLHQALKIAALSGIDVRIMIPAHPDHLFVYSVAVSYLHGLMEAGAKCYKYESGFVHSKLVIIDGIAASVGTANMDIRSFRLNFETNAFVYDEAAARQLEANFFNDILDCTPMTQTWFDGRTRRAKIMESVSRLLAPIL